MMLPPNKILTLLVGPPGSGKTTFARDYPGVRISQDDEGKEEHFKHFEELVAKGERIIVDRMNFSREQRARYLEPARSAGYETRIIVIQCPYDDCLKGMTERWNTGRVTHPTIQSEAGARAALKTFFTRYEKPKSDEATFVEFRSREFTKSACIVVDLDGTLCDLDHRLHHVRNGKKDWDKFLAEVDEDVSNDWCVELINAMAESHHIVYASGRPADKCAVKTLEWLKEERLLSPDLPNTQLFMRFGGDFRSDTIVKEIILDFEILPRYRPLFVVDDRKSVVEMWRSRGLTCLQCAPGEF